MSTARVDAILERYGKDASSLLAILQDLQDEANYLPRADLDRIAEVLDISPTRVYGMATFFKVFSLKERGKHVCQVCLGTACHVRGAERLTEEFARKLEVDVGETTPDKDFTLETVNCVGACALGPVVVVNGQYHGSMSTGKVEGLLGEYGRGSGKDGDDA
jgi:NADH-quinone oxidoreductase subunit E